jgi:hypothetical protein
MSCKRTGTIEWVEGKGDKPGHYKARLTLADGSRPWVHLEPGHTPEWARDRAAALTAKAWAGKASFTPKRGPKAHKPASPMISAIAESWLKLLGEGDLAPATISMHTSNIKNHVRPAFGNRRPDELTSGVLLPWIRGLRKDLEPSTVRNAFNTLSKLIDDSMAEEWIDLAANPTKHPKVRDALPTVEPPDAEDIAQMGEPQVSKLIRDTTAPERRIRHLFQALTGAREGEVCAVRWSALTEEHGTPLVRIKASLAIKGPAGFASEKGAENQIQQAGHSRAQHARWGTQAVEGRRLARLRRT